jgi:tRNA A-37 threonylcarbamoyl transferase component Bud32
MDQSGLHWEVVEEFAPLLPQLLSAPGETIKTTELRWVGRFEIEGRTFYLKRNRRLPHLLDFRARFVSSQSRRDWRCAARLREMLFPVVPFLALGERRTWRGVEESVLISEGLPGFEVLSRVTDAGSDLVQAALGRFLRQMHDTGISLRDLHPGNLLFNRESERFCLMDLDTVRIRPAVPPAIRFDHLARLRSRLVLGNAFFAGYGEPIDVIALARHAVLLRRKRCVKTNRDFRQVTFGERRWWVRTAWNDAELAGILKDPDAALAKHAQLLKQSPETTVGAIGRFVIKAYHAHRPYALLKDCFRSSRSHRAYRKAYHLELAGIPTARPVAVTSVRTFGVITRGYFVMERIAPAVPLREFQGDPELAAFRLARLIGAMHRAGFSHRDLKDTNLVFDGADQPFLIDVDGSRFVGVVPPGRVVSDLARFARGALRGRVIPPRLRRRFLREYCRCAGAVAGNCLQLWRRLRDALTRGKQRLVRDSATRPSRTAVASRAPSI